MTYAQGGLIEATDYNNMAGSSPGDVSTSINSTWAVGYQDRGYGQTAVSQVSVGNTVTAAQWASLINAVNNARKHQAGAGYTNLGVPAAGDSIAYLNTLQSRISDAYTNRLQTNLPAGVTLQTSTSKTFSLVAASGVAADNNTTFTVSFASVDAARYFYNTGGYIQMGYNGFTNNDGNARGTSIQTLFQTNFYYRNWWALSSTKGGTGGTVSRNYTYGYYSFPAVYDYWDLIYSSGYYSSDFIQTNLYTSGGTGSNNGNGSTNYFQLRAYSGTTGSSQPSDSINVTLNVYLYVYAPVQTYISNSWGTITIS